jgi:ferric-dicitrate binding protein FerR (iron transport regulator)
MDRIMTGTTPTEPMPVVRRSELVRPTPSRPVEHALMPEPETPETAQTPETPETPETPKPPETPEVSPARRSAGTLIAIALLALLVIGAAWFVMSSTRAVTDKTGTSAPRP